MNCPRIIGLLMVAFMLFAFSKEKGSHDIDSYPYQMKGKVKAFQETKVYFDTATGTPISNAYGKTAGRFNEQGDIIEILYYKPGDSTLLRRISVQNIHNAKKRVVYTEDFRKGRKRRSEVKTYDKNGKLVKLIYFTPEGLKSSVSEYDGLGNRCSVTQFKRHNGWPQKTRISYNYNYDSLGRLTEERHINEDGSLLNKYIHKYDKKGNEIETDIYNTDSTLSRKVSAQFDSHGNRVDVSDAYYFVGGGDMGQKRTDTYDDNGFKIEEDSYRIKADGAVVLLKAVVYENDKTGNWIKATSFDNSKKGSVATRVIEYY